MNGERGRYVRREKAERRNGRKGKEEGEKTSEVDVDGRKEGCRERTGVQMSFTFFFSFHVLECQEFIAEKNPVVIAQNTPNTSSNTSSNRRLPGEVVCFICTCSVTCVTVGELMGR